MNRDGEGNEHNLERKAYRWDDSEKEIGRKSIGKIGRGIEMNLEREAY